MVTNVLWMKVDGADMVRACQEAREKLASADAEVVLDFSAVHRVDAGDLRAMEDIADASDGKVAKVVLQGVNIDIYKVLKLTNLASRFVFRT